MREARLRRSVRAVARRLPAMLPHLYLRLGRAAALPAGALRFARDWSAYRELPGSEPLRWRDALPMIADRVEKSPYDPHYFYQDVWAARRIAEAQPTHHVDVGSRVDFVGFLTALTSVTFVDIRPLEARVDNLECIAGSVLELPFGDRSLESVSCLHVAEHIGLGRYGDPLDPAGTRRAASELQRVLRPGGELLFSVPVGQPRVCFNAHRIHDPHAVREMFDELELAECSGVDDRGVFARHCSLDVLARSYYACGLFRFIRHADASTKRALGSIAD